MSELNDLTYKIRSGIFNVHKELGPGLLESIYEIALIHELRLLNLTVQRHVSVPVYYKGIRQRLCFRLDLLVNDEIIIEIKSISKILDVHQKQLLTYLKLTNKKLGLLVNFNVSFLKDQISIFRLIN